LQAQIPKGEHRNFLFTENETNTRKLFGTETWTPYVKDAFHEFLIQGRTEAVNPKQTGTKAARCTSLKLRPAKRSRLDYDWPNHELSTTTRLAEEFDCVFRQRMDETETFYAAHLHRVWLPSSNR